VGISRTQNFPRTRGTAVTRINESDVLGVIDTSDLNVGMIFQSLPNYDISRGRGFGD